MNSTPSPRRTQPLLIRCSAAGHDENEMIACIRRFDQLIASAAEHALREDAAAAFSGRRRALRLLANEAEVAAGVAHIRTLLVDDLSAWLRDGGLTEFADAFGQPVPGPGIWLFLGRLCGCCTLAWVRRLSVSPGGNC